MPHGLGVFILKKLRTTFEPLIISVFLLPFELENL